MKDKSIKSTMKSWIMLSEKELDDTQVYMQEQEQQDQQEKDNSFSEAESGSGNVGSAKYESQVSDAGTETFSDEENGFERKLSREEQVRSADKGSWRGSSRSRSGLCSKKEKKETPE